MMLRYSFDLAEEADLVEKAVADALAAGARTADILQPGTARISTREMGDTILRELAEPPSLGACRPLEYPGEVAARSCVSSIPRPRRPVPRRRTPAGRPPSGTGRSWRYSFLRP